MTGEQDDLITTTDDESLSENEDPCLPVNKPLCPNRQDLPYVNHTTTQFVIVKVALVCSTLGVVVMLPIYTEKINVQADVYSLFFINTLLASALLLLIAAFTKFCSEKSLRIFKPPTKLTRLLPLSGVYFVCGLMVVYATDRRRVVCHVQDPLKGLVLVACFLCYFFFSQRFMCIQRIFSATVIIVGLFIAVDYSLCNEFKCRGYERQHVADDKGPWNLSAHTFWSVVYVLGLSLFAVYLNLMEYTSVSLIKTLQNRSVRPSVSQISVTTQISVTSASSLTNEETAAPQNQSEIPPKKINATHLAMWIHILGLFFVIVLYGTDYIPGIAKGANATEVWDYAVSGFRCHFSNGDCGNVVAVSWPFVACYVIFVVSSIRFVILAQSAVYASAVMATALPLAGIWWSLFQLVPNGELLWAPQFSGELISSIIGLAIMTIGLYFLHKSHLHDYKSGNCVSFLSIYNE